MINLLFKEVFEKKPLIQKNLIFVQINVWLTDKLLIQEKRSNAKVLIVATFAIVFVLQMEKEKLTMNALK